MLFGFYGDCVVRIVIGLQLIWSVNSVAPVLVYRTYETADRFTKNALFAILIFGETWNNNHSIVVPSVKF